MNLQNKRKKSGFVLLFTVLLSSIILAVAFGIAELAVRELRFTTSARESNDAFYAADTGAECALFHDRLAGTHFPLGGPKHVINCLDSAITPTLSVNGEITTYNFNLIGLGSQGDSCAKVTVVKDNTAPPIKTTIYSKGYNFGDVLCASTTPANRIERAVQLTSIEPLILQTSENIIWVNTTPNFPVEVGNDLPDDAWTGSGNSADNQFISSSGGYMQFTVNHTTGFLKAGLGTSNATNSNQNRINFAIYLNPSSQIVISESGNNLGVFGNYVAGDVFKVAVESGVINYYQNNVLLYTSLVPPTFPLYAQASLYNDGDPGTSAIYNGQISYGGSAVPLPDDHTLTVTKAGVGSGTITSSPNAINCTPICQTDFSDGTDVTLTASPQAGSIFTGWSGGGCSGVGTCTLNMDSDKAVTATFVNEISFIGSASAVGDQVAIPPHQAGDLILIFAYRHDLSSAPPCPGGCPAGGWISLSTGSGNFNGARLAYRIATNSNTTSGVWNNGTNFATHLVAQVYRGVDQVSPIGAIAHVGGGAGSTHVTYPALVLASGSGASWVAGFGGHRSIDTNIQNPPAGMTNRTSIAGVANGEVAGHDTNGTTASWVDQLVLLGGTSSGWRAITVEITAD